MKDALDAQKLDTIRSSLDLAQCEADLQRHRAALARLQDELAVARQEVAGTRGEAVYLGGMLRRAQHELESLRTHNAALAAELAILRSPPVPNAPARRTLARIARRLRRVAAGR